MDSLMSDARWEKAQVRGRCTNRDYCKLGDSGQDIVLASDDIFVCPECSRPLRPLVAGDAAGGMRRKLAYGAAALLMVSGASFAGFNLLTRSKTATAPLAAAPARAAAQIVATQGTSAAVATPPAAAPAPAGPRVLLRLAGSNTLGPAILQQLARAYLTSVGNTAVAARQDGAGQTLITSLHVGEQEAIALATRDAAAGAGKSDVLLSDHLLSRDELAGAALDQHLLALQATAVIVNPRNEIATLTVAQLRNVMNGSVTTWSQLGVADGGDIHLLLPNDGSADSLSGLVPDAHGVPGAAHLVSDVAAAVADDPDALALVHPGMMGADRIISIDGGPSAVAPTQAAIMHGDYPLARKIYLYAPADDANPVAARFAAFAQSDKGQSILAGAGLLPVDTAQGGAAEPQGTQTPRDQYNHLLASATRLDADLHFETNSNKLDLRSMRAVDRISNYMFSYHNPPDHMVLVGFADNQGTPESNLALSLQRAQAVAALFKQRGLTPGMIVNLGADLPIADNATQAGREKNRRVEVFLRN
jgi:phosphate transport system substrate-binding protein